MIEMLSGANIAGASNGCAKDDLGCQVGTFICTVAESAKHTANSRTGASDAERAAATTTTGAAAAAAPHNFAAERTSHLRQADWPSAPSFESSTNTTCCNALVSRASRSNAGAHTHFKRIVMAAIGSELDQMCAILTQYVRVVLVWPPLDWQP